MTVIVKDMMLPDCCAVCELSDSDDDGIYCNVLEEFMRFDELPKGRRSDCPLFDENTETIQSIVLNDRYANIAEYAKVIRCMDCKYWSMETEQTAVPNMRKCTWWRNIGTLPIDFCSRAERRGEEWKK